MDNDNPMRRFLIGFFRQGFTFVLVAILVGGLGVAYLIVTKPVYEVHSSMLVKFGKDARSDGDISDTTDYAQADYHARQEIIQSYIKIMLSRDLLRGLVNKFGASKLYPDLKLKPNDKTPISEVVVDKLLGGDLKVTNDESHVIEISVRNHDPRIAMEISTFVMDAFVRERTEIYNTPQTDFLQQQIDEARRKLDVSQKDLQAFKQQAGISAIDEELSQLLKEKGDLTALAYTAITDAQKRLADLQEKQAEMQATYRDDSPMLQRLHETLAVAQDDLKKRKNDLNAPDGNGSSLAAKLASVDKRISYLELQRGKFNELQQQVTIDRDNYLIYLKRGEEARINNLLNKENITSIDVMDHPALPASPVKPKKLIVIALTFLAAMFAAAGTALSKELLDDRLTSPEKVYEALGVPVLASFE
ncbi:MAG TPA: Wzz/FepE/Etk N-terminal domain-containing protein [Patescibacteria group bacterium]|nr:Wzz/FepE/Etk N-terminal domain-containing protein [Patescibacteria group bacterium]